MKEQIFPKNCKGIIDVTKAPYFVDNTGKEDVTEKLCKIVDDVVKIQIDGIEAMYQKLKNHDGDVVFGFENRKIDGLISVLFPEFCDPTPTIYFPNGVYRVSDTISYSYENLQNRTLGVRPRGMELATHIRILGQSRENTIIKLDDNCKGFEFGQQRALLNVFRGDRSNVAMSNYVENITLDVGKGNPGAVGLIFFANNSGSVRCVSIVSSDENHKGAIGLAVLNEIVSGCFVRDISVDGFEIGIKVEPLRNFTVFEEIRLKNQRFYGMEVNKTICSIRDLVSENTVTGLYISSPMAHVILTGGKFTSPEKTNSSAISIEAGCVLLKNIETKNYSQAFYKMMAVPYMPNGTVYNSPDGFSQMEYDNFAPDGKISEYCSYGVQHLFRDEKRTSINLEVPPIPDARPIDDLSKWISVNDFGAVGDGTTDDTEAIQKAFNSGYPVVWFQPGRYYISAPISVPASVRHIHGMFSDVALSKEMIDTENQGVFTLSEDSDDYIVIEKFLTWEQCYGNARFIKQACKRTVLIKDVHTQTLNSYFNTVPGSEVFFENVATTSGGAKYRHIPCFEFHGQKVWGHHMNPERSMHEIINDHGQLWLMGFKTEGNGPLVESVSATTEILGGIMSIGKNSLNPIVLSKNSDISVTCSTNAYTMQNIYPVAVTEVRDDDERHLMRTSFPSRFDPTYFIPLFVGYGKKETEDEKKLYDLY